MSFDQIQRYHLWLNKVLLFIFIIFRTSVCFFLSVYLFIYFSGTFARYTDTPATAKHSSKKKRKTNRNKKKIKRKTEKWRFSHRILCIQYVFFGCNDLYMYTSMWMLVNVVTIGVVSVFFCFLFYFFKKEATTKVAQAALITRSDQSLMFTHRNVWYF